MNARSPAHRYTHNLTYTLPLQLLGGDETGDTVFECFEGGDVFITDFEHQCRIVEEVRPKKNACVVLTL